MTTPICDFINKYVESKSHRLHMPGHKGVSFLGFEKFDITEIDGADALYQANGIIEESEKNATEIFGSGKTAYSCEGSSLSVRAMLYLAKAYYINKGSKNKPYVLATRNAHSSFISAAALVDFDVEWLYPDESNYISGKISTEKIKKCLSSVDNLPFAVYITSPDYLGNICDIKSISEVCKSFDIPLLVDNAHGAYLKFLKESKHPIDLGATMCCDSAHKTLPVLTGGGYLHVAKDAPAFFSENLKAALALFGSTSPSYLILASLDNANKYLTNGYFEKLQSFSERLASFKAFINSRGYKTIGDEVLKITISAKSYGYTGYELYNELKRYDIVPEMSDPDYVVLMLSPNDEESLSALESALKSIPKKSQKSDTPPSIFFGERVISIRDSYFSPRKEIDINNAEGKVLALSTITCPPAVSIAVAGERMTKETIELCKHYGIKKCYVIK